MEQLLAEGLSTEGFLFDTALGAYLLAPTDGSYALDRLSVSWLNFQLPDQNLYTGPEAFAPLGDPTQGSRRYAALYRHRGGAL